MTNNTLSQTIGVETECGLFMPVLKSGTVLPCRKERLIFAPAEHHQSTINIKIKQGDNWQASNNTLLGGIQFDNLESCLRGIPQISLSLYINSDGFILALAEDLKSNITKHFLKAIDFRPSEVRSEESIAQDQQFRAFAKDLIVARRLIKSNQNIITSIQTDDRSIKKLIDKIQDIIRKMEQAMSHMVNRDLVRSYMNELSELTPILNFRAFSNPH